MVTTATDPSRFRAATDAYDGVVRVSYGGCYASGALLYDGRAVLTAAHLFACGMRKGAAAVTFETASGTTTIKAAEVLIHPGYDPVHSNHDLALVWLSQPAPAAADRYALYLATEEVGKDFVMVGYGRTGTGASGANAPDDASPVRLWARNRFDAEAGELSQALGSAMAWSPAPGTQLVADFDDGTGLRDALGRLIARPDAGLGDEEGLIAAGDSGSPAFVGGLIAGVGSYIASLATARARPDVDAEVNSSFGEIAAWQRVSAYQQWIDQSLRDRYPDAPTSPGQVKKAVREGDSGTTYAYFLVQFTGVRSDPQQILSVDYATRDGTAVGGLDYIPASGTLRLYPGENQAVIPVEVIGDTLPEPEESFYLDVFNPVGGSFGAGVVRLTAVRSILDDDAVWWL